MRVMFIRMSQRQIYSNHHPQNVVPPLDIAYCMSVLEDEGHHVDFIDTASRNLDNGDILKKVEEFRPEIAAVSFTTVTKKISMDLAGRIKGRYPKVFLIAFGQHPSSLPGSILGPDSAFDACIRGESEMTFRELVGRLSDGMEYADVDGISYHGEGAGK